MSDYTRALEIQPGNATAYHNRASLFERLGRLVLLLVVIRHVPTCLTTYTMSSLPFVGFLSAKRSVEQYFVTEGAKSQA